jgi:hypothetical protein
MKTVMLIMLLVVFVNKLFQIKDSLVNITKQGPFNLYIYNKNKLIVKKLCTIVKNYVIIKSSNKTLHNV